MSSGVPLAFSEQKGLGLALGCIAILALSWCRGPQDGSSPTALRSAAVRVGVADIVAVQREPILEGPSPCAGGARTGARPGHVGQADRATREHR
jgi:hypothetical protein